MLTVSLHGICIHAPIGLYPEEKIKGNDFEVDVDVFAEPRDGESFPFMDYAEVHQIVLQSFEAGGTLLETLVRAIHSRVKKRFAEAVKVRVAVRKMAPPLGGEVRFSQVCYEA